MSGLLLSTPEFAQARPAVRAGDVTPALYGFLHRLVTIAQRTRTLAPAPVPGGRWDDPDAIEETVHAWLDESLLRGGLLQAFDVCLTPAALSRYLERALRNWLISRSRRSAGPRLLDRAARLLDDGHPFRRLRDAPALADRWWGLDTWPEPATLHDGPVDAVVSAAWALGDFALLRYPSSERSDPVLSTAELRRFVLELLEHVGAGLSGAHIDACFRNRFTYAYAPLSIALADAPELTDDTAVEAAVLIDEAARLALAALTARQLRVVLERPDATLEEMATRLGVSRGTVDNEWRRALLTVREAAPSGEAFDAILETVIELASGKEDR